MTARSTNRDDYQNIPQPVAAMAKEFARGAVSHKHQHRRAQLLYAVKGLFEVTTADSLFLVPPQHALWLPPQIDHEVRFRVATMVRTLYIDRKALPDLAPSAPRVVHVSPLLRELIVRLTALPIEYAPHDRVGRLASVTLEEIVWEPDDHLHLPLPKDKRLRRLHEALVKNPADNRSLEDWAKTVGASSRTLARLFQSECGTSFLNWRQQVRILAALPMLSAGVPVISVALDLGYETPSAFTAMFRRITGILPSQYFSS